MRNSLRESFSVPESKGETGPTAQWLDMAADAAATAAADALELELKEEVRQASPLFRGPSHINWQGGLAVERLTFFVCMTQ